MLSNSTYKKVKSYSNSEKAISSYINFVQRISRSLSHALPATCDSEDLVQVGLMALLEIYDQYDENSDVSFEGYAHPRVKGAMIDFLRESLPLSKEKIRLIKKIQKYIESYQYQFNKKPRDSEVAQFFNLPLKKYHHLMFEYQSSFTTPLDNVELSDPNILSPEHYMNETETAAQLVESIKQLSEKEQMVLSLYYYDECTQSEVAEIMELTESRVCQILRAIKIKLREMMTADANLLAY